MRWITALHLNHLASQRRCEELLPEIIRKLIVASCEDFPKLDLPVGDSVSKPGWDGTCKVSRAGLMVPKGQSFWEFGRSTNYFSKFKEDFEKRETQTKAEVKKRTIFIFVTPRKWSRPEKTSYLETIRVNSSWKDILIYDADNLELWLEQCPAVAIWLARELGLFTQEVISASTYWKDFTRLKEHTFDAELILSKREHQKSLVTKFFSDQPYFKELQASSKAEGAAFVIASMISSKKADQDLFWSRSVVVEDKKALKQLLTLHKGLYVIFLDAESGADFSGEVNGNHVISIVSYLFSIGESGISLPLPKIGEFAEQLSKLGFDHQGAYKLAEQCGKSITVLRRMLTDRAGRTSWSLMPSVTELLPLFFVQKLDDEFIGDREVIAKLFPGGYEPYKAIMKRWSLLEDRPISQIINHWQVVSSYDLLFVLGKYITEEDLALFAVVVKEVALEIDPALELERKQRFAAELYDKRSRYSPRLKKGMLETLALIAVNGKAAGIHVALNLSYWADQLVGEILAKPELEHWQTIENRIDLLSEASPATFLTAVEGMVRNYPDRITELFDDSEFDLFGPLYFTHILYSLEAIAWDPRMTVRVALLLADLCKLDQGSRTANRAFASLKAIFLWWMPQTYAGAESRQKILTMLSAKRPAVAFRLLENLSPRVSETGHHSRKPIWRLRDEFELPVNRAVYDEGLDFTCTLLISMAANNAHRWETVIRLADNYVGELRSRILDAAVSVDFASEGRDKLRTSVKEMIYLHANSVGKKTAWNLSKLDQEKLATIYERLISNDVERYAWYFDVEMLEKRRSTRLSYEKIMAFSKAKRKDAMELMLASCGIDAVLQMANSAKHPFYIGVALAGLGGSYEGQIFAHIAEGGKLEKVFRGYVMESHQLFGLEWVMEKVSKYGRSYPQESLVNFYLAIEATPALWELLDQGEPDINNLYWSKINTNYHPWFHKDHHEAFVGYLKKYGRFATIINSIHGVGDVSDKLIIEVMDGYVSKYNSEPDVQIHSGSYIFGKMMERLVNNNVDNQTLVRLQWQYFQVIDEKPKLVEALFQDLCNNPENFAQLVYFKWKPDEGDFEPEFDQVGRDSVMNRGLNADEVLGHWRILPGMDTQGNCDFQVLNNYFSQALELCVKRNRRKRGMFELGAVLGRGKFTGDPWQCVGVCDLIDNYDDEEFCRGFAIGYNNRNGVRVTSGGYNKFSAKLRIAQLREAAEHLSLTHPVTAKVINKMADSKEHWDTFQAKRAEQSYD